VWLRRIEKSSEVKRGKGRGRKEGEKREEEGENN